MPAKDFDFTNEINIYDHKVAICSFDSGLRGDRDMFGVIIESKEVAETQRQIFEMAWRYAALTTPKQTTDKRTPSFRRRIIA